MPTDQNQTSGVNPVNSNNSANPNTGNPQGNQDDRLSLEDLAVELNEGLEEDIEGKKIDNQNNTEESQLDTNSAVEDLIVQPEQEPSQEIINQNVENVVPEIEAAPVEMETPVEMPAVEPIVEPEVPAVEPIEEPVAEPVVPEIETAPVEMETPVEMPAVEPVVEPEVPAVEPVEEPVVEPVVPEIETAPVEMETPVEMPAVEPVVEPEVPAVEPIEEPVVPEIETAPVEMETPVEMPTVEPVVEPEVPAVEPIEEPVVPEIDTAPVEMETPVEMPAVEPVVEPEVPAVEPIEEPVVDTAPVVPEIETAPVEMEIPVTQVNNGEIVSDTGSIPSNQSYVPNESDFAKMSAVLDSAPRGEIDLSSLEGNTSVDNNQADQQSAGQESGMLNLDSIVVNTPASEVEPQQPTVQPVQVEQPVDQQPQQMDQMYGQVSNNQFVQELEQQSIDGTMGNIPQVAPQGVVAQQPQNGQYAASQMQPDMMYVQESPEGNKKFGYGLKILLLVVILLGVAGFILSKMYPDEVSNIVKAIKGENTTVIEYSEGGVTLESGINTMSGDKNEDSDILGNQATGQLLSGDENQLVNNLSGADLGDINGSGDNSDDQGDDVLDPSSLEALLSGGNDEDDVSGGLEDNDSHSSADQSGLEEGAGFDTMKELGLLIDEENSDKTDTVQKLQGYIKKATEYQLWGEENNNEKVATLGTNIISETETLLETIETTGEIDNTKVEKIELKLSKIETLINK